MLAALRLFQLRVHLDIIWESEKIIHSKSQLSGHWQVFIGKHLRAQTIVSIICVWTCYLGISTEERSGFLYIRSKEPSFQCSLTSANIISQITVLGGMESLSGIYSLDMRPEYTYLIQTTYFSVFYRLRLISPMAPVFRSSTCLLRDQSRLSSLPIIFELN